MRQAHTGLQIQTPGRGFLEITRDVQAWVAGCAIGSGLLTMFIRHTSASLLIQENADPEVTRDLERFFARLVRDPFEVSNLNCSRRAAPIRDRLRRELRRLIAEAIAL